MLRTIRQKKPLSMREVARLTDRDIRQVSDSINELAALGVIELVQDGRSKRPVVEFNRFVIDDPLIAGVGNEHAV